MPTLCKYNHTKINIFFGYATFSSEKIEGVLCKKMRNKRRQETSRGKRYDYIKVLFTISLLSLNPFFSLMSL